MPRPTAVAVTDATATAVLRRDLPDQFATAPVMRRDIECSILSGECRERSVSA
jgi:hypothetical protein